MLHQLIAIWLTAYMLGLIAIAIPLGLNKSLAVKIFDKPIYVLQAAWNFRIPMATAITYLFWSFQ